jgi:hypothetical protein
VQQLPPLSQSGEVTSACSRKKAGLQSFGRRIDTVITHAMYQCTSFGEALARSAQRNEVVKHCLVRIVALLLQPGQHCERTLNLPALFAVTYQWFENPKRQRRRRCFARVDERTEKVQRIVKLVRIRQTLNARRKGAVRYWYVAFNAIKGCSNDASRLVGVEYQLQTVERRRGSLRLQRSIWHRWRRQHLAECTKVNWTPTHVCW